MAVKNGIQAQGRRKTTLNSEVRMVCNLVVIELSKLCDSKQAKTHSVGHSVGLGYEGLHSIHTHPIHTEI